MTNSSSLATTKQDMFGGCQGRLVLVLLPHITHLSGFQISYQGRLYFSEGGLCLGESFPSPRCVVYVYSVCCVYSWKLHKPWIFCWFGWEFKKLFLQCLVIQLKRYKHTNRKKMSLLKKLTIRGEILNCTTVMGMLHPNHFFIYPWGTERHLL